MSVKRTVTTACVKCATMGGFRDAGALVPSRRRGLCHACYQREQRAGRLTTWALVGYVPMGEHPIPPPATVDLSTLVPRIRTPWGAPQHPRWQKTVAYEQRRAAEWLAARERVAA